MQVIKFYRFAGTLAIAACGAAPAGIPGTTAVAQRVSRDWIPADRAIIGDFSRITTVAAASDRVFATSPSALLVWRPQFQRWEGPFEPPEMGTLARVGAALVDPLDNSLWLARPDGWVHYQPDLDQWTRGAVQGQVQAIAFDMAAPLDGLYLRTTSGWQVVPRGGFSAVPASAPRQPMGPASINELIRTNPTLQANSARILSDARLREARYTSAAQAFDRRGWFIGTWGVGLLFLPEGSAFPQRLPFGLVGDRANAVWAAPGGVWVATERTPQSDAALTFVSSELNEFRTLQGPPATGLPFARTYALAGQGISVWAGTDAGVARVEPAGGRVELFDEARGLPDRRALSLVSRRGQITVGTARGVAVITDSLRVVRIAPNFVGAALAVEVIGDTTWIGTASGLFAAVGRDGEALRPRGLEASPSLQVPVVALSWMGDTLVALTPDQLLWRSPRGAWSLGPALSSTLGRLRAFTPERDGFWVAGDRGVAFVRLNSPPLRPLFQGDLPGNAYGVAADADFLWVATDAGLVRFRLDAIRP